MNKLDRVIIDQLKRVGDAGAEPLDALEAAKVEIMGIATVELVLEIMSDSSRTSPDSETRTSRAQMRSFQDPHSIGNRASEGIRVAHNLARLDMVAERQGYTGGIIFDGEDRIVHGHSTIYGRINPTDPIQVVSGDSFYPAMMWAKALRGEAYKNRPESAQELSVAEYMAKLGLTLGASVNEYGDLHGATGFMPGLRLESLAYDDLVGHHILSEPVEEFRLSGLCDQSVLTPEILTDTQWLAAGIVALGGTLN